jgi:hypothetical protein
MSTKKTMALPVVLYGCDTWYVTSREDNEQDEHIQGENMSSVLEHDDRVSGNMRRVSFKPGSN